MSDHQIEGAAELAVRENGLSMLIDAVAARSARRAVNETFFLLGVDLNDPDHIRSTRDVITHLRDQFEAGQRRKETWSKGLVHGAVTLTVGLIIAVGTFFMNGHWSLPGRQ